eukprot:c14070_g1_i1.p1 GENE.c14070_g1_i1~~c14070_g1_i1.p1  ORF type:complete len:399 (+),score=62.06 c14070_g1_i1:349-1545(+)
MTHHALITMRIWFSMCRGERSYDEFFAQVTSMLRQKMLDPNEFLVPKCIAAFRNFHNMAEDAVLVLFVDELARFEIMPEPKDRERGDQIRTILCRNQDSDPKFRVVFSSLNYRLMLAERNRDVKCLPLILSPSTVAMTLRDKIEGLSLPEVSCETGVITREAVLDILIKLVGCHPRALGKVIHTLKASPFAGCSINTFLSKAVDSVVDTIAKSDQVIRFLPNPEEFLKIVLSWTETESDVAFSAPVFPDIPWSRLCELGFVQPDSLVPSDGITFRPVIPPMLLQYLSRSLPRAPLRHCIEAMFSLCYSWTPQNYEMFFFYFEKLRRCCRPAGITTLSDHFPGSIWTNDVGVSLGFVRQFPECCEPISFCDLIVFDPRPPWWMCRAKLWSLSSAQRAGY